MAKISSSVGAIGCIFALAASSALAQPRPSEALRRVQNISLDIWFAERSSGKSLDSAALKQLQKEKAIEVLRHINVDLVPAKDAFGWAKVFSFAHRFEDVTTLCQRFLSTSPSPTARYQAELYLLENYNALGQGKQLAVALSDIAPPKGSLANSLGVNTLTKYADTIAKTEGVDETVKVLDRLIARFPEEDHRAAALRLLESVKASESRRPPRTTPKPDEERLADFERDSMDRALMWKLNFLEKRAELLGSVGRGDEGIAPLKQFASDLDAQSSLAKPVSALLARLELIGKPAPTLEYQLGFGEFKGLEGLRGKVVIVDSSQLPGRSYWAKGEANMSLLYGDLHGQGLEVVSVLDAQDMSMRYENEEKRTSEVQKAIRQYGVTWPVVYGGAANKETYNIAMWGQLTIIDRKGNIRFIDTESLVGRVRGFERIREQIELLLKEK